MTPPKFRKFLRRYWIILLGLIVVTSLFIISGNADFFELIHSLFGQYEAFELDEVIELSTLFLIFVGFHLYVWQRELERELRDSEEKLGSINTSAKDAIILTDEGGKISSWNPAAETILGYKKEEAINKELIKLIVPKRFQEDYSRSLKEFVEIGFAPIIGKTFEMVAIRKDGTEFPTEISTSAFKMKGKWQVLGIVRDITERQKTLEKLNVLIEKLGVVGKLTRHDVRNKLSAVVGNTYLIKKTLPNDHKALAYLQEVESACKQTTRILDFAATYESLGAEELTPIDIGKAVEEAVTLTSNLQDVKVINECHGLTVIADSLLKQLFYNLIDNSLKHGEKVSRIRAHYKEGKDGLKLFYEDDGVGIPKDMKQKIFDEGYTTGKGSGYGLYMVKKMIEVYGWTIQETGTPGKGAQFTMTIPRANKEGKENYQLS